MKRKALALFVTTCMLAAFVLPAANVTADPVTPGYKSANFNLQKANNTTYVSWAIASIDMRSNDGKLNIGSNHTNRNAGDIVTAVYDLQTQWQLAAVPSNPNSERYPVTMQGTHLDAPPTYNKLVYNAGRWNTTYFEVLHEPKDAAHIVSADGNSRPVFTANATVTERREINKSVSSGNATTDMRHAFSFDATSDRYVGFRFQYKESGSNYASTAEIEVFYVTPNSVSVVSKQPTYITYPGAVITDVKAKILDIDGDEILDGSLTPVHYTTDAAHASIDPNTGALTVEAGFEGEETFNVTATSTVPGCTGLSGSTQVTIHSVNDPTIPRYIDITTDQELYALNSGDTIGILGGVRDSAGNVITDPAVTGQIVWSMQTACPQLSIDPDTGAVTATGDLTDVYSVTVTAALGGIYNYSDSVTFTVYSTKKSFNYNLNATGYSGWANPAPAMVDGSFTTTQNGGNHSNSTWVFSFGLKDWTTPKPYNKAAVHYTQYNTEHLSFATGTAIANNVVSGGISPITKNFGGTGEGYDHLTTGAPMKQVFSFDAVDHPYVSLTNKYLRVTNDNTNPDNIPYFGKNPTISEVQLYYVLPAGVVIEAADTYAAGQGAQIALGGAVIDVDGDVILDSDFSGLGWTIVSGGDGKVSIDPETGVLSVNQALAGNTPVTVRAQMVANGYDYFAEKTITLTSRQVASVEIKDVPDFIMTNSEQASEAILYPGAIAYGHVGEILTGKSFTWSVAKSEGGVPEGVTITGNALKVAGNAPVGEITLTCAASGAGEDATASVTIKINQKVDLVRNKLGWVNSGWQVAPGGVISKAVDGNSETVWNTGGHSRGAAAGLFNPGGGQIVKANYFRLKIENVNNSTTLRIAGSNTLESAAAPNPAVEPPTVPDQGLNPMYMLVPRGSNSQFQGTTFWSGYSEGAEEAAYAHVQDNVLPADGEITAYFKDGMQAFKYIGIVNYARSETAVGGIFSVNDFEVYNTAPNYVKISLPADQSIGAGVTVPMEAALYNGVAAEAPAGTGTWSASGFIIDESTGELTVPGGSDFVLGTITYNYESDILDTKTTVYACADNGTLKFANTATEFLDLRFSAGTTVKGNTIYVPEGITADALLDAITFGRGGEVYVVEMADGVPNPIESGLVLEAHKVYIVYGDIQIVYDIAYASDLAIDIVNDGGDYTAATSLGVDVSKAALILAEYDGTKLVRLVHAVKTQDSETLSVTLKSVAGGNSVRAMLVDSLITIKPLRSVQTN